MVMLQVTLMKGEWSCYRNSQFNRGRWSCYIGGGGSLKEGEWSCYRGGQFKGGRMVMLHRWSI